MWSFKTATSMISQTKSSRIRSESNPQNWRTKGTHFLESQKVQNSKAGTDLDILFRLWYLCWNLTKVIADAGHQSRKLARHLLRQDGWKLQIVKRWQRAFNITGLTRIEKRSFRFFSSF
jgi:hypothetical protein